MIAAMAVLLGLQLIGEVAVQISGLPIPGPVVGMILLFIGLRWRESLPDALRTTAETLLSHLPTCRCYSFPPGSASSSMGRDWRMNGWRSWPRWC